MSTNHTHNLKCLLGFLALTSAAALTPVAEAKPPIASQTLFNRSGLQIESPTDTIRREGRFKPTLETIKPNTGRLLDGNNCCGSNCACDKKPTTETLTNPATFTNHSIPQLRR